MPAPAPEVDAWVAATRHAHDRFVDVVAAMSEDEVRGPSYASEWTIADTASHLGSQAEIFAGFVAAGRDGTQAPGPADFGPVWDRWNALPPTEQVSQSVAAGERLVVALETMPTQERDAFALSLFGRDLDLAGTVGMRLGEVALHGWDVAVMGDPAATLSADAVDLLVDTVPATAGRSGTAVPGVGPVEVLTSDPERSYRIEVGTDAVEVVALPEQVDPEPLRLPAEAFLRLIAGRLDPDHAGGVNDARVDALRTVFTGF